jgi:ribosome maturation factor RimP
MSDQEKLHKLKELIEPAILEHQAELVNLELKGGKSNSLLRVTIDKESGVTLKLCEEISRKINYTLMLSDLDETLYRLEVTSPGADRPLKTKKDFERNREREFRIRYRKDGSSIVQEGKLESVTDGEVTIRTSQKKIVSIPFEWIERANVKLPW